MGVSTFKRSAITLGKDGAGKDFKAFGATSGSYMKWDKATDTLQLVNADIELGGDVEVDGDLTLTTEDVSIVQGRRVYLAGQDSTEYISSEAAGYTDIEAATAIRPGADLLTDRWRSVSSHTLIGMGVAGAGNLTAGNTNLTGFGYNALNAVTSGDHNSAFGASAMAATTTGVSNAAFGRAALTTNIGGHYNSAFGSQSLQLNTGIGNSAFGFFALGVNAAGGGNTAVGFEALGGNTSGGQSVAVGYQALRGQTTGQYNIAIGHQAGDNITTGDQCIIIGWHIDAPSTTADAQLKIGGSTGMGYILGDSTGDMMVNALSGKTVELAVNGTAVVTAAGALVTLAQITSITDSTEASAVGTASLKTAGGLGVAGKAYIGTELFLVAGPIDMTTAASDLEIKGDTDSALEIKGTATLLDFDTRVTVTGVTAFGFTVPGATIASASGVTRIGVAITPGTTSLTGAVLITAMEGLGLNVTQPTITSTGAGTVTDASTVYIAAAPVKAGSLSAITNAYALKVAAGQTFFGGAVFIGTDASPITITAADYQLSVHTTVDTAGTGWMNPIAFDMESTASAALSGDVQMVGIQAYARLTTGSAWTSSGGFCGFSSVVQTAGTTTATSGVMSAITAVMQIAAGHTSSLASKVAGIVVQNQVNSSAAMGDHFSGILIMGGAYETLTSGIKIEDGATITAINIDACTTGINISGATTAIQTGADASDGGDVVFYGAAANELLKWDSSEATLDVVCKTVGSTDFAFSVYATQASLKSEGIAAMLDATISGTPTGHSFAVGAWLNIVASSVLGAYDFRGLDVGVYDAGAASSTAAKIYGICISTYIGATANPAVHAMMRFNTTQVGGDAPDYWFLAANPVAVAWTTNTVHTDADTAKVGAIKVKITGSTGDPGYIYIYSDAGS